MSEHTPGPWHRTRWLVQHHTGGEDEDGVPYTEVVAVASKPEDAPLIAAAPELLTACEEAEAVHSWLRSFYNDVMSTAPEYAERCGDWNAVQYMMQDCANIAGLMRAAIAKARGARGETEE